MANTGGIKVTLLHFDPSARTSSLVICWKSEDHRERLGRGKGEACMKLGARSHATPTTFRTSRFQFAKVTLATSFVMVRFWASVAVAVGSPRRENLTAGNRIASAFCRDHDDVLAQPASVVKGRL
jgi:hypothetical protein